MDRDIIIEGTLTVELNRGRKLSALVFGVQHALRTLERWAAGECEQDYQTAGGDYIQCARPAGHEGHCSHRQHPED